MVQLDARHGLEQHGVDDPAQVHWNLTTPALYEHAVRLEEGLIAQNGPIVFHTGRHTGRSPKDKFLVRNPQSENHIWWRPVNQPIDAARFDALHARMMRYLRGRELFVQDCTAVADPRYRVPIRVVTEMAYHSIFTRNMFLEPGSGDAEDRDRFTIFDLPSFEANPDVDATRTGVFVIINFEQRLVLIGGTSYGGEIKKSVFTILNYLLPQEQDVFSMHCSANYGQSGDVALFFGLSGTGKTTLSTDPERTLIGDDEHGWSDRGVFNFEGGCYAKTINISEQAEPEIFHAVHRFGSVLENVIVDPVTRELNLDSDELTENTRAAFPISYIPHVDLSGVAGHPRNVIFLTADAFGVLPPVARLTREQAQYYFLSGYTAKVAGTEKGVTEPQPNFSTCFAAPFLVLPPIRYAEMLGDRLDRHGSRVWLINTGWSGGPYGIGRRIDIAATRAIVRAVLRGELDDAPTYTDEFFGLRVPEHVPNVDDSILHPRSTWPDPDAYDEQARKLASMFRENFAKMFHGQVPAGIAAAGPSG